MLLGKVVFELRIANILARHQFTVTVPEYQYIDLRVAHGSIDDFEVTLVCGGKSFQSYGNMTCLEYCLYSSFAFIGKVSKCRANENLVSSVECCWHRKPQSARGRIVGKYQRIILRHLVDAVPGSRGLERIVHIADV